MKDPFAEPYSKSGISRRSFLKSAGAAVALSQSAWARGARVGANDRITIGVIGWGMIGPANTKAFLGEGDCQVVAACDLHKKHLQTAVDTINGKYGNQDCKAYRDYDRLRPAAETSVESASSDGDPDSSPGFCQPLRAHPAEEADT
jgi:hypothetical protein